MTMSWQEVAQWYDKIVGKSGHYFHESVIIPGLLKLFDFEKAKSYRVLDLGCGEGVLARHMPSNVSYTGVDISKAMVDLAKKKGPKKARFLVSDLTSPLSLEKEEFSHIVFILSLQNMENTALPLKNAKMHLARGGKLYIVLNHPCFRIPRQTSWGIDAEKKVQYRRLDRYLTPLAIPIAMNPSQKDKAAVTTSFHYPLSHYVNVLGELGLGLVHMEEWVSLKASEGKMAKMENRAREEFPLFLLLVAQHML